MHPDDVGALHRAATAFMQGHTNYDVVYHSRDARTNEYRLLHALGRWQTFSDGSKAVIVVYNDLADSVSEIGKNYAEYTQAQQDQFYTDPITELPNTNYLKQFGDQRAEKIRLQGKTPVMIYFDIRSMHSYNYEYGYVRGDELLRLTAREIKAALPSALVSRGTDDHFIVIDAYSENIKATVEKTIGKNKKNAYGKIAGLQASIVTMEPTLKSVDALDRARHVIKDIGDDLNISVSVFSQENNEAYWMRRYITQSFDKALENNWIRVYYQAIVRTQTKKVTILEALARWIDPVRGMIPPRVFIPVLSRYHLLYKLDLYMAEQICKEFELRKTAGLPLLPVSVNFSAQDFDYVDIPSVLDRLTEKYGLEKNSLIVEVTEQDIAQATDQFKTQLQKLHESGYRLWVDDFGSGYSSLNVFGRYHVDRIKFDMEMLRHLDENNGANRVILRSIVEMCREIGVHTLVEGVETEEQYRFLREIGCEMVQGFHFYKPEPVEVSAFKIENLGPIIPCETPQEREMMGQSWLKRESDPFPERHADAKDRPSLQNKEKEMLES